MKKKPWGGRFKESTKKIVEQFTSSIDFDKRLYKSDIRGSIAHIRVLGKSKIVPKEEVKLIIKGLTEILKEIEKGKFQFDIGLEDIHMNIEKRLVEKVGDIGKKLHTGRSRNDQVALDMRLYLRDEIGNIISHIEGMQDSLIELAKDNVDVVMPGYTHLQHAQPILFAHHLMAYFEMLDRDKGRFGDCLERVNVMPLGSGALAGTSFPTDRYYLAKLLDFPKITENSLDAVSDRDFCIEFLSTASILMMHLSRFSEELILWSTAEFDFIELPDAYCTGSSMMPQKKNPDIPELIRGKTGRIYGNLVSLLTTMKALPLAYNRDMQEDKEPVFDTVDTIKSALAIYKEMLGKIKINKEKMLKCLEADFSTATEIADYLVRKGIPFRKAHEVVGKIVGHCLEQKKVLTDLNLKDYKKFNNKFEKDIFKYITIEKSIDIKKVKGGTAKQNVKKRIEEIIKMKK